MAFSNSFAFVLAVILVLAVSVVQFSGSKMRFELIYFRLLLFIGGGMFLLSFVNYSPREILASFRSLFSPAVGKKKEDYDRATRIFRTMSRYAWAIAGSAFLIGLIKLQLQLCRVELIAPNMAFSVCAILYGLFWGEVVCGLCEVQATKKAADFGIVEDQSTYRGLLFPIAIVVLIAALFHYLLYDLTLTAIPTDLIMR